MSFNITDALLALKPESGWVLNGNNYSDLEWLDKSQTKPTEDEINAKIAELETAEPAKQLREIRNRLLAESDWVSAKATDTGVAVSDAWKQYRQELRDLPLNSIPKLDSSGKLDLISVPWPKKP